VVTFPNLECTTIMSAEMKGTCLTNDECSARSGQVSGNCASGFGVCCFVTVEDLQGVITQNMTYIQNPGYPTPLAATTTATNYQYTFQAQSNTAAIRLDFSTTVLQQPTVASGACGTDILTTVEASRPATATYTLCGTLSGQHMYLENNGGANNLNSLTIALPISTFSRSWKILVRQIEMGNPSIAGRATGCLQWYTGLSNRVSSFNHANGGTIGVLNDDSYTICVRREGNNDCVQWREAGGATDSFALGAAAAAVANAPSEGPGAIPGNAAAAKAKCFETALIIPDKNVLVPAYCGGVLSSVTDQTQGNIVISDEHYINVYAPVGAAFRANTAAASGGTAGSGFDLIYQQTTCNGRRLIVN